MRIKIMGNKIGMSQIFSEEGKIIPVTVVKVGPCYVVGKKTEEKNGYTAFVLGYDDVKENRVRKSELGLFSKAGIPPKKILFESRVKSEELEKYEVGQEINLDMFKKGDYVDVTSRSKGRGFTGVVKRYGMAGAKSSHGTHEYFRHVGSIGSSAFPSRVFKGKRMPGRYGGTKVTVQNLSVVDVKPDKGVLLLKGAVPGPNRGYIFITHAVKKSAVTTSDIKG